MRFPVLKALYSSGEKSSLSCEYIERLSQKCNMTFRHDCIVLFSLLLSPIEFPNIIDLLQRKPQKLIRTKLPYNSKTIGKKRPLKRFLEGILAD